MAKVAKVKKRDVSIHSRAARRGESGSDQVKAMHKAPVEESDYKPWLHNVQNGGVGKKKTKPPTRQQRLRQQKGLEKAEVNLDKLDKKVSDSASRGKKVDARRIGWDELNEKLPGGKVKDKRPVEVRSENTRPMEDVLAPDVLQPSSSHTDVLHGSGEALAQAPDVTSTPQLIAPAPPLDEDVDVIT